MSEEHAATVRALRKLMASSGAGDGRAQRAFQFQSQPFFVAEPCTPRPGIFVSLDQALASYRAIIDGDADAFSEQELLYTGALPARY